MKPIHATMVLHLVVLVLFGLWALSATQHQHHADHYTCGSDSDCSQFGGNGGPAQ